jgi:hypothetical protein
VSRRTRTAPAARAASASKASSGWNQPSESAAGDQAYSRSTGPAVGAAQQRLVHRHVPGRRAGALPQQPPARAGRGLAAYGDGVLTFGASVARHSDDQWK